MKMIARGPQGQRLKVGVYTVATISVVIFLTYGVLHNMEPTTSCTASPSTCAEASSSVAHTQLRQLLHGIPSLPISTGDPLNPSFIASDTHRFVYLRHVGKVAGTTVHLGYLSQAFCKLYYGNVTTSTETVFGNNTVPKGCLEHLSAERILYKPEYGASWQDYEGYYTFAFLRNPYSRAVSSYFYLRPHFRNRGGNASKEYTFKDFLSDPDRIARYLTHSLGHHSRHWESQVSALLTSGVRRIDYLGCTENLVAGLQHVVDQVNAKLAAGAPKLPPVPDIKQNARTDAAGTFQLLTSCNDTTPTCSNYAASAALTRCLRCTALMRRWYAARWVMVGSVHSTLQRRKAQPLERSSYAYERVRGGARGNGDLRRGAAVQNQQYQQYRETDRLHRLWLTVRRASAAGLQRACQVPSSYAQHLRVTSPLATRMYSSCGSGAGTWQ